MSTPSPSKLYLPAKMKITPHFTVGEMTVSATASRAGRAVQLDFQEDYEIHSRLEYLCQQVLEPLRKSVRKPIVILSGYRPEWLNKMVGGSPKSDHLLGAAADFIIPGMTTAQICKAIKDLKLPYKQLIHEFPPNGWVHVSLVKGVEPAYEQLTATKQGRKTIYLHGILS